MAMNKKEMARMLDLELRLLEAEARMVKSERVEFDLMPPKGIGGPSLINGWSFNAYTKQVNKSCSCYVHHGKQWDKTSTQGAIRQFSTELLATQALRYEVEQELYKELAKIDKRIAELKISQ